MNRSLLTTAWWLLAILFCQAQDATVFNQVIGTTGRSAVQQGRSYSYTLGEVAIITLRSNSRILTQGFHQPEQTRLVSVFTPGFEAWEVQVFPNPVSSQLTVRFSSEHGAALRASVFDLLGRQVVNHLMLTDSEGSTLDCQSWEPGVYFLILSDPAGQGQSTTRIIKQ